ncbi:MAG: Cys-tRNA(Pro) deacylase [Oscillospiraceae bacterium]|nr:Cys-tRNA(Pro) deacylase [Oscillospiraceae bacterium]
MAKDDRTNVMRLLAAANIVYADHQYDPEITDGENVAALVGKSVVETFKTLVTQAPSGKNYVFVIPVHLELDLKAAARSVSEKSIEMIPQKKLMPLTGYVHGGCSPVGLKRNFPIVFDESCLERDTITLSAGKRGRQITVKPMDLISYLKASTAPLSRHKTSAKS